MNPLNAILSQMMNSPQVQNNPMAKNAMDMYRKGDSQGLKTMAENLCRENGTTIEQMKNEVMQRFNLR
jgi:hypothetical protein|nr:MAG TPA_asm: hypothetical protein [Caudoviricetes sp.]